MPKYEPQERNPCAPKSEERTQDETLQQDAPAEQHGTRAKSVCKLRNTDKATFYSPIQVRAMPAPTSEIPEEREFEVDSGASICMLSKKDSSSEELDTLRKSRKPTTVITANEEVQTKEEAQVHVHDLELFVTVQILDDTPAVLSLGTLCAEHGCTYEWASGQKPHLTTQGKKIL